MSPYFYSPNNNTQLIAFWFPTLTLTQRFKMDKFILDSCPVFTQRSVVLETLFVRYVVQNLTKSCRASAPKLRHTYTFAINVRSSQTPKTHVYEHHFKHLYLEEVNRLLSWWSLLVCKKGIRDNCQGSMWGKYTNCLTRTYVCVHQAYPIIMMVQK